MRNAFMVALLCATSLCVSGCGQLKAFGVTCVVGDVQFTCGINEPSEQDSLTLKESKDEKPDWTFPQPLPRLEEDAP